MSLLRLFARWRRHRRIARAANLQARADWLRDRAEFHAVDHIRDGMREEARRLEARAAALWKLIADDWRAP